MQFSTVRLYLLSYTGRIIMLSCIAHFGALWLGQYIDDVSNRYGYIEFGIANYFSSPFFNRFPAFGFAIYPMLLSLPPFLAHWVIIITHTANAILLYHLLSQLLLPTRLSYVTCLLFAVWPVYHEPLYWMAASTIVFGVFLLLLGLWMLTWKHHTASIACFFLALLFSEAIFLPAVFLVALLSWFRISKRMAIVLPLLIGTFYGVFQAIRATASSGERITQYAIDFTFIPQNILDLLLLSLSLSGSRDLNWLWQFGISSIEVARLMTPWFVVVAGIIAAAFIYTKQQDVVIEFSENIHYKFLIAFCITGISLSITIYSIISSNQMQPRYVYISSIFSIIMIVVTTSWVQNKLKKVDILSITMCALMTMSIYRTWSNSWANWYPAHLINTKIIEDVRSVYNQTNINRLYLVNEPKSYGNAYALTRDWAYLAAGRMEINPDIEILADELLGQQLYNPASFVAGQQFSDKPCVFVSWRDKLPFGASEAITIDGRWVLDCTTGTVKANAGLPDALRAQYTDFGSAINLVEFSKLSILDSFIQP